MSIISKFTEHMDLMAQMFARTGASDTRAWSQSTESELKQAMYRCSACTSTDSCKDWLETAEEGAHPPGFCRNVATIERLMAVR